MKRLMAALAGILILASCSQQRKEAQTINIEENHAEGIDVEMLLGQGVKYITLDTASNVPLIGRIQKAIIQDSCIYISDYKSVHSFNLNGKYLTSVSKSGRGSGEYMSIADFCVQDGTVYLYNNHKKLMTYNMQGECLNSAELDFYPASITILPEGNLLLTSAYQSDADKFHIFSAKTLQRERTFFPIDKAQITWRHFMGQHNFYLMEEELLFHEPMNDTIYTVQHNTLVPKYILNLYGENAPAKFYSKEYHDVMEIMMEAVSNGYAMGTPEFAEFPDAIVFTYKDAEKYRLCVYSKQYKTALQSDTIRFKALQYRESLENCIFSFNGTQHQAIIFPGAQIPEKTKTEVLGVDADYDDIVICFK